MTFREIKNFIDEGKSEAFAPFEVSILEEIEGWLCVNNFIPMPIIVKSSYDKTNIIEIKDRSNYIIGYIYFSNGGNIISAENMADPLLSAYLKDVSLDDFQAKADKKIVKDYFVIAKDRLTDYLTHYYASTGIWGGYIHDDLETIPRPSIQSVTEIQAIPNIKLPTSWHQENMIRAVQQPFAFERFLKNYHLLELLFDWQAMKEINDFYTENNFNNAAKVLREYERDDIKRIKDVISKRHRDINAIVEKLNNIVSHQTIAKEIFYTYGKESNPLKSESKFDEILTQTHLFQEDTFNSVKQIVSKDKPYNKFILDLVSYWIYRIRSSIAHSKIGEYQLSYKDEAFMVEFAEPLLQEVVIQCFTMAEIVATIATVSIEKLEVENEKKS